MEPFHNTQLFEPRVESSSSQSKFTRFGIQTSQVGDEFPCSSEFGSKLDMQREYQWQRHQQWHILKKQLYQQSVISKLWRNLFKQYHKNLYQLEQYIDLDAASIIYDYLMEFNEIDDVDEEYNSSWLASSHNLYIRPLERRRFISYYFAT